MKNHLTLMLMVSASVLVMFSCSSGGSQNESASGSTKSAPELDSVNPEANDSSVLIASGITATFDHKMDPAAAGTFVVYGSLTGLLSGVYSGGGSDTLRFDPAAGFKIGEEIEVILTDLLTSSDGLFLESPVVYRFRAEALGGIGNFTAADSVVGQTNASALSGGDWDGDGDLDLASANNGASRVDILINDGAGDFTAADTVSGQTDTRALAAGDWDGDGDLDLASANNGANRVDILINDGAGDFTAADSIVGQTNTSALAAGDWDVDGDLDLASANFGANTVDVLKNQP